MASSRRWLALTAFVALIAGAGGVSAGILIASPPTPASLASSSAPSTVPVTTREFTDTRSLTLTIPPGLASRTHLPHRRAHHGASGSDGNSHHLRFYSLRDRRTAPPCLSPVHPALSGRGGRSHGTRYRRPER